MWLAMGPRTPQWTGHQRCAEARSLRPGLWRSPPQQWPLTNVNEMTRALPGPQQDAVMLTSLLVWRTEGWDPGGRILRGAPTERLCPCGSWRDCGRSRGCCPEPYRGRGSWEPGSGIVSCRTTGTVRRRNGRRGEGHKPLPTRVPKSRRVTLGILISKGLRRGHGAEQSGSSTEQSGSSTESRAGAPQSAAGASEASHSRRGRGGGGCSLSVSGVEYRRDSRRAGPDRRAEPDEGRCHAGHPA